MNCRRCTVYTLIALGIPLIVAGIIVAVLGSFNTLAEDEIKESLPLKDGSKSFERWEKPKGDLFIEYYIFNITNSDDIKLDGSVHWPKLQQLGPYTYREDSVNNVKKREGQTITFEPSTKYVFDRARSCDTCDEFADKIITLNYPALVLTGLLAAEKVKGSEPIANSFYNNLTKLNIGLFQTRSVHEILWGYKDPVISRFLRLKDKVYALQFNNSGSGTSKIYTGEHDVDRVTKYIEWKSNKTLRWWNSPTANMINGTGGTRFRPFIDKDDELYVLVTEICRSLKLKYDSTVKLHGIKLLRFAPPEEVFETGDINPDNKGFCVTGKLKKCLPSGLLDISACKSNGTPGPPFIASPPHFYSGDANLAKYFHLNPQKENHGTFLDIEPNTGLTMRGHKRLQLNFLVPSFSVKNLLLKRNTTKPIFLPVFFTDESAEISEDDADEFKTEVLLPIKAVKAIPYAMIGLGALLLFIAMIISVIHCWRVKKQKMTTSGVVLENYPNGVKSM